MRRLTIGLLALALAGCAEDTEVLEGARISVLSFERALAVDPRIGDRPVAITPPFRNAAWAQPGGFAPHAAYHLALDGLAPAFAVPMVSGNRGDVYIVAPPVSGGGKVFAFGTEADVAAVDAATGAAVWRVNVRPESITEKEARQLSGSAGGGVAYAQGRLFATTGFGEVLALDAETGDIVWRAASLVPFSTAPTVHGGRLYAVSRDSRLQVFDASDGARLWEYQAIAESATLMGATSPAVDEQVVVAGFDSGEVAALRVLNGTENWSDSLAGRAVQITPLSELNAIVARPVIDRGRVFAVSHGGRMVAIDLRTGARVWTADIGAVETPWVMGDYVFVVSLEGQLVCLLRETGQVRWVRQLRHYENVESRKGRIDWTGPVLAGGRLLLASSAGELVAVSPESGEVGERIALGAAVNVTPIVADGTLYMLTDDGTLLARR